MTYLAGWRKNAIARLEWSDVRDGNIYLRGVYSKNKKPYYVPVVGELVQLIERREEVRSITTDSGVRFSSLVFHRAGKPIAEFRKSWAMPARRPAVKAAFFMTFAEMPRDNSFGAESPKTLPASWAVGKRTACFLATTFAMRKTCVTP